MIVLARRVGEEINIDDGRVLIRLCKINGQRDVEIGIVAPKEAKIIRLDPGMGLPARERVTVPK